MAWFAFYVLRGSDAGAGGGGRGALSYGGQGTVPSITGSMLRVRGMCCVHAEARDKHNSGRAGTQTCDCRSTCLQIVLDLTAAS